MNTAWNPDLYQDKHSFVWQLGEDLIDVLQPQSGERILDLGCGTGQLIQAIAERGAVVIGVDANPAMIAEAQQQYPHLTLQVVDACALALPEPVDAIFSNAVIHWIADQTRLTERLWANLKPGGRLVVEFGGKGNMAIVLAAIAAARQELGYGPSPAWAWYFPALGEYAKQLESFGFEVQFASLRDRPTPLEGEAGLVNWLKMFAGRFWADLYPEDHPKLWQAIAAQARPQLYRERQWWADYRRLRVVAKKAP